MIKTVLTNIVYRFFLLSNDIYFLLHFLSNNDSIKNECKVIYYNI